MLSQETKFIVNGKEFIVGALSRIRFNGKKIIVDAYGGVGRHGGGCFSGKDPSKVDKERLLYVPVYS